MTELEKMNKILEDAHTRLTPEQAKVWLDFQDKDQRDPLIVDFIADALGIERRSFGLKNYETVGVMVEDMDEKAGKRYLGIRMPDWILKWSELVKSGQTIDASLERVTREVG